MPTTPTPRFIFDEAAHRYTFDGRIVRGVTGLIRDGGLVSTDAVRWFTEESRWRGTRVHKACLDIDLDCYSWEAPESDVGYIESYLKWRHLVAPRWTSLEEPRYSARWKYCGIADRIGFDGKGRPVVLDFKTGGPQKWHAIQLALYDMLHSDMPWGIRRRVGLYLHKDGSIATSKEYADRNDYSKAIELTKHA